MTTPAQRPDRPTRYPGEISRWLVPSESKPDYPCLVDMDEYGGVGWCACEDFQFRKQPLLERSAIKAGGMPTDFRCKHLRAVVAEMKRLRDSCRHGVIGTVQGKQVCEQCGAKL